MAKFNTMLVDDPLTPTTPEQREAMRVWWEDRRREVMKEKLHRHEVNNFNRDHVSIEAEGIGDPMNRATKYLIKPSNGGKHTALKFQDGPVTEAGVNGITDEALLAIVLHRLECFQRGAYRCRENAIVITKLEECLMWLRARTEERERRGVEGTSKV